MPRKTDLTRPTKRQRQRAGRWKESRRAKDSYLLAARRKGAYI